jgi:hypothetical protein
MAMPGTGRASVSLERSTGHSMSDADLYNQLGQADRLAGAETKFVSVNKDTYSRGVRALALALPLV